MVKLFARAKNKTLAQEKEGVNWQKGNILAIEALLVWFLTSLQLGCWPCGGRKNIFGVKMADGMQWERRMSALITKEYPNLCHPHFLSSLLFYNETSICFSTTAYTNMSGPSTTLHPAREVFVKAASFSSSSMAYFCSDVCKKASDCWWLFGKSDEIIYGQLKQIAT